MSVEVGGGVRTALVWAPSKELLTERIATVLGEFAAEADDVLHLGYGVARPAGAVGPEALGLDQPAPLEYSALLLLRA